MIVDDKERRTPSRHKFIFFRELFAAANFPVFQFYTAINQLAVHSGLTRIVPVLGSYSYFRCPGQLAASFRNKTGLTATQHRKVTVVKLNVAN